MTQVENMQCGLLAAFMFGGCYFDVTITLVEDTRYSLLAAFVFDGCYFDVYRVAQWHCLCV